MKALKSYRILLTILLLSLIFYFPSLKYGFAQDDFIHLSASRVHNITEVLNFFNPYARFPDIFFYRPLATQFLFYTNSTIFGLNPLPFHIEGLILHIINTLLFYLLVKNLLKSPRIALLSSLLYGISSIHFLSLYYISSFQQISRTFFIFLSVLLFIKYLDSQKIKYILLSIITYLGALLSKETSLILPAVLTTILIYKKENLKSLKNWRIFLPIIPFILITLFYLIIRFFGFQSIFNEGDYKLDFSIFNIFQNLKWYLLWIMGLPEIISAYPSLKPDSILQFIKDYKSALLILLTYLTSIISLLVLILLNPKLPKKILLWGISIFFISLLPVLVLHGHRYPQYLDLTLLGFLPLISWIITQTKKLLLILPAIFIISYFLLQYLSLNLSENNHWTTHRSKVADHYHETIKSTQQLINKDTTIIFTGTQESTRELSVTLAKHYALENWLTEKPKEVIYLKDTKPPSSPNTLIIPITVY